MTKAQRSGARRASKDPAEPIGPDTDEARSPLSTQSSELDPGTIVTMRDIAAAAGVSMSTVSRVLNDAPSRVPITPVTRDRVVREATRLGFRPNPFARALRGAPTKLLGAVVRGFGDPFFAWAIEALAMEATAHGYNLLFGQSQGYRDDGLALPAVLAPWHCDAVLVLGEISGQPRLIEGLRTAREPVVAMWQGPSPTWFPTIDVDDTRGIEAGLEHLVALGHERIAFVSARLPGDNPEREQAYLDFMADHFGGVPEGYLQRSENSLAGGEYALERLLRLPVAPTAVACANDVAAVGVLHGAHSHGVHVPDALSVVGYDDLMFAAYTIPALTTLRMPTTEIVREGVRVAIELIEHPSAPRSPSKTLFAPTLIVRGSTAPPRETALMTSPRSVAGVG
jgi:DNA-binding LacI/PurR family transcriptional regulator